MKKLLAKIRKILKDRRTRQLLTRIVSITAAVVVFITTYALVLPAITMESEANCGIPAHQHDDSCYEDRLICGQVESPGHQHTDACYSISKSLICMETEHQHDDSCFDADGNLTCELAEHTHDDACYEEVRELVCNIPESEGHEHTADCYERVLACGMEAHTHSTACYSHTSDLAASASVDFAAVATTELGSYGATVSASTEAEADSTDVSNAWAPDENATDGVSSTSAAATSTATADYSSTATAASTASTGFDAATAEDAFVPQLEPIIFEQLLTEDTGIYYYHAEEGEEVPENSADIADWKLVNDDTELAPADLLRVYLRYTIPAGSINATNDIARYRLPSNIHLTDQQMETINTTVNGIANQYLSLDTLEITNPEKYNQYLGIEATEGTRTPSDDIDKYFKNHPDLEGQEYISAVVRAENVFDDTTGEYVGQDLVFTFSPYTVQKNQHEYDVGGQPTKAGQKVNGWLCFDLHMDQIDWPEPVVSTTDDSAESSQDGAAPAQDESAESAEKTASEADDGSAETPTDPETPDYKPVIEKKESSAEIIFAAKDKELNISEISTSLHMVELNTLNSENDDIQDDNSQSADDSLDNDESKIADPDTTDNSNPEEEASSSETADATDTNEADQPESAVDVNAETYPAVSFEDTITVQAGTLSTDSESASQNTPTETTITVSVIAEEETFPLGTTMQLGAVEDMDTVASAVEGTVEGQTRGFHAVDISFHNADGEEIEPLKPIRVSMTSDAIKQAVEDSSTAPVVVHVENPAELVTPAESENIASSDELNDLSANEADADENSEDLDSSPDSVTETSESAPTATIIETSETSDTDRANASKDNTDTLTFDAGSFSIYAIVYTVDFHYEVNGKTYEFSIPGGGFVSLEHLVEKLGVTDNDTNGESEEKKEVATESAGQSNYINNQNKAAALDENASNKTNTSSDTYEESIGINSVPISEKTKQFVANVEKVKFSSPELVWVGKADAETTVGSLKETNKLDIQYSADLTEEQIQEINAQTVNAGDWALISVQPFTSEESLTVIMDNGEQWTVKVTDAQISTHVITADGEDYIITVTYGPEAGIPDGAKLEARELLPGTEEYEEHYQNAWVTLQDELPKMEETSVKVDKDSDNYTDAETVSFEQQENQEFGDDHEVNINEDKSALKSQDDDIWRDNPESEEGTVQKNDDEELSTNPAIKNGKASLVTTQMDIGFIRFFDITIKYNDKKIEPDAPVYVRIEYANPIKINNNSQPLVVHFADDKTEVIKPNGSTEEKQNEITAYTFEQSSFSVTATLTGYVNPIKDGRYLILARSSGGRWFAMDNHAQAVDVTDKLDNNGKFKEVPDDCLWTFTKNTRDNYYKVTSGDRYLRLIGNSRTGSGGIDSASNIGVTPDQDSNQILEVRLINEDNNEYNWRLLGFNENGTEDTKFFLSQQWSNYYPFYLAAFTEAVDVIDTTGTKVDDTVHYIITDHYPSGDVVRESANLSSGGSASFAPDPSSSVYAGVAVTTGHDAVSIGNNGNVTVSYNSNVHLVHVDYYYKDQLPTVQTVLFNQNDKYDTKEISGHKYYELSQERLHTDKTASVVEGGDGRSFNLTLEAWNVDWNIATVGMVLDASGSMAWDGAPGHVMQVNSDGKYEPYKFLSQAEVNKILYTDYSDYSPAGYGNYTYFVYENGKSVNEYAPLGYFDSGSNNSNRIRANRNYQYYLTINGSKDTAFAVTTKSSSINGSGWYYVNTSSALPYEDIGGAKEYDGIVPSQSNKLFTFEKLDGTTVSMNFNQPATYLSDWLISNDSKYRNSSSYQSNMANTPAQFYVDDEGYLHCFYFHSNEVFESYVYKKTDEEPIKTEMLQDAIGSFTGTLHSIAPDSAIGMTRFSRSNYGGSNNGFNDNKLTLLNWTTDSASIISALNLSYGSGNLANGSTSDKGYANAGNMTVYNYGLTGNTSTQSGLTSFNTYLASNNNALTKWAQDNAKPVSGGYEYDKYVIVFTDGKDTDRDNSHSNEAKEAADSLKAKGYNVITVLLAPQSAFDSNGNLNTEFSDAKNFLDTLNGARTDTTVTGLDWTDTTFIATAADKSALRQIFVDIAEKIAKTMTDMTVRDYIDPRFQLVDENDNPISLGYHPELGYTLGYDSARDMQYVEWTGQDIPTNNVMDNTVVGTDGKPADISLWSETIRVRAKDDFLGGNEVLSNGNVENLNKVYPDGQPNSTDSKVSRTFPRTTVNPQILDLHLGSTEDTLFLGETIDTTEHEELEDAIGATVDSPWYYEYLTRYGTVTNTDYISQLQQGTKVEIPYYYMPEDTDKATFDAARLNPNNVDAYMKDKIGTLMYEWVPCDAEGNEINLTDPYNYLLTNTDDVHYKLKIKYTPLTETERNSYVSNMIDSDSKGRPVKDPVGTDQIELESAKDEGIATVHVVSGQLTVSKQVLKEDMLKYLQKHDSVTFTFALTKTGTPAAEYPALGTDYKDGHGGYTYPTTISVTLTAAAVNAAEAVDGYVTITGTTVEKLPIGTYEILENTPAESSFEFETIGHLDVDANYRASVSDGTSKVTFEIGELATDASITNYVQESKPYLNAQRISVYARNKVNLSVPVSIKKVDVGDTNNLLKDAVFSLYDSEAVDNTGKVKPEAEAIQSGITTHGDADLGFADLNELDIGTYYLVETSAPVGYVLPEYEYIKITVEAGEVRYQAGTSGEPRTATTVTRNEQEVYLLEVYNSAGVELPASGGPGTNVIYIFGIMLTGIASVGLVMRRRRKVA